MTFQESIIVWLQAQLHPQWDTFFSTITELGGFAGMIILIAFIIWSLSYPLGCRLLFVIQFTHYISSLWLKAAIAAPRPFLVSTAILPILPEKGFSFPSGHSINALLLWGAIAWLARTPFAITLSIVMIFLIGFSRVFLGVHYPTDILGGYTVAGIALFSLAKWRNLPEQPLLRFNLGGRVVASLVIAGFLWAALIFAPAGVPQSWVLTWLTIWTSATLGWYVKTRWIPFEAAGSWLTKGTRFVLGVVPLFLLLHFFPKSTWVYGFAGLWITAGVPWLATRRR